MSTSIETMSELDLQNLFSQEESSIKEEEEEEEEIVDFYTPRTGIPPRFVPSRTSFGAFSINISLDTLSLEESSKTSEEDGAWVDAPRLPEKGPCPSQITVKREEIVKLPVVEGKPKKGEERSKKDEEKSKKGEKKTVKPPEVEPEVTNNEQNEEEILKAWFEYHLWQKRMEDMNDPNAGWAPQTDANNEGIKESTALKEAPETNEAKIEWMDYLNKKKIETKEMQENVFVNTCVLLAIKQFVFDYFYETFLFTLLKIAFGCSHSLITQEVNDKWYVPKIIKTDLKKPKPKKPPKEKKVKVPKPPKEKKEKPPKPPKEKKEKAKKEKPQKLTKEEKEELARLKMEEALLEEEKRRAEENRRFMFPLGQAANDEFYESIFEGWVKIDKETTGKDKKKKKKK